MNGRLIYADKQVCKLCRTVVAGFYVQHGVLAHEPEKALRKVLFIRLAYHVDVVEVLLKLPRHVAEAGGNVLKLVVAAYREGSSYLAVGYLGYRLFQLFQRAEKSRHDD